MKHIGMTGNLLLISRCKNFSRCMSGISLIHQNMRTFCLASGFSTRNLIQKTNGFAIELAG